MNESRVIVGDLVHIALIAVLFGSAVFMAVQPSGVVAFNSVEFGALGGAYTIID